MSGRVNKNAPLTHMERFCLSRYWLPTMMILCTLGATVLYVILH